MANLKFININKIYRNNVQAVYDFNLEVEDKEFIVLVGPSGCGKSTTLRMLAGLEEISSGELYLDNRLINYVEPKDRDIAMVFQNYALYPHMTVFGNMSYGLKNRKTFVPQYEENEEINSLTSLVAKKSKELNALNKKATKKHDNTMFAEKISETIETINKSLEKIDSLRKPITGYDNERITFYEKLLTQATNRCARIEKALSKAEEKDKDFEILKKDLEFSKHEIEGIQEKIDFYKKTEVGLTKYRFLNKNEIIYEVNKAAQILDLQKYLLRKPSALSGGQCQRVALGRAIVKKPKVFLMDEPLSNLDAKLRVQTRSEISRIHKKTGATTIYVTHDQTEAMTLADRIVIMKDGKIQQIATPSEAFNNPANIFVAGFIGSPAMNFIEGTLIKNELCLEGGLKINLGKLPSSVSKYDGKQLIIGIRPENVFLKENAKNIKASNSISLTAENIELLGEDILVYSSVCGQNILAKINSDCSIKEDETKDFVLDLEHIHYFDPETTLTIKN